MIQRDVDATALVEQVGPSIARSSGASVLPTAQMEEEHEELLNYTPVPPRNTQMLRVRFRPGARVKPLPYCLDEENP
jgi:hypothetical protein